MKHHCPNVPILILGTQENYRYDQEVLENLEQNDQKPIKFKQGQALAKSLKCYSYLECNSESDASVYKLFSEIAKAVVCPKNKKSKCTIQ